jgi:hypothetical protein
MAFKRSATLFVQTGKVVQEEPTVVKEVLPADNPVAKKAKKELRELVQEKEKLTNLAAESTVLYQSQSIFPFQLFPDRLIVESDKVTLVHRTMLWKNIFPMLIENINSVTVSRGVFFACLSFELTGYETNPGSIEFLWPEDAAKAKRYILGLIRAKKQGVDISKIPNEEMKEDLEEIGRTTGEIETLPLT